MSSVTAAASSLLTFSSSSSSSSSSSPTFSKHQFSTSSSTSLKHQFCTSSSPAPRLVCRCQNLGKDLPFVLHDALDACGIDSNHARAARDGFCFQIGRLSEIERHTSISINRSVDLGRTALHVAAEDDSLVSHSSVPLPVDAFIERLDDLSMGFCSHNSSSFKSLPDVFLKTLERFLYGNKGFRRATVTNLPESRTLYLHSVLTHRSGSAVMLSLIYSEILKMLRLWGILNFDVEIYCPHDLVSLPRGYHKQKSKVSDQPHILTSQSLLVEILRNLKDAFWPFRYDPTGSLFLRAARAAKCIGGLSMVEESGFERAAAKAAQHRLERGVWTSVRLGDMRLALSACERLILLEYDFDELRDYSILLYHCGFYEESLQYLKLYQTSRKLSGQKGSPNTLRDLEDYAVEELMSRLNLILMEDGWSRPSYFRSFLGNYSEPW